MSSTGYLRARRRAAAGVACTSRNASYGSISVDCWRTAGRSSLSTKYLQDWHERASWLRSVGHFPRWSETRPRDGVNAKRRDTLHAIYSLYDRHVGSRSVAGASGVGGHGGGGVAAGRSVSRRLQDSLVRYAVVDRIDGLSRDLYVSRAGLEALKRDPRLREFPVGVLFALDVHSAKLIARDRRTGAPTFASGPDGHLARSKDEHTLHLMQKIRAGVRQSELGVRRVRPGHRRAIEARAARRLPPVPSGRGGERHDVLAEPAEAVRGERGGAVPALRPARTTGLPLLRAAAVSRPRSASA